MGNFLPTTQEPTLEELGFNVTHITTSSSDNQLTQVDISRIAVVTQLQQKESELKLIRSDLDNNCSQIDSKIFLLLVEMTDNIAQGLTKSIKHIAEECDNSNCGSEFVRRANKRISELAEYVDKATSQFKENGDPDQ